MTLDEIKSHLCKGEYSSFSLKWNDDNGPNYTTVEDAILSSPNYYDPADFVGGPEEMQRCIETNSLWTAHWYPTTPVGFCLLHASTFETLLRGLMEAAQEALG